MYGKQVNCEKMSQKIQFDRFVFKEMRPSVKQKAI